MPAVTFDGNDTLSLPAGRDFDGTANQTCLDYSDFRGKAAGCFYLTMITFRSDSSLINI